MESFFQLTFSLLPLQHFCSAVMRFLMFILSLEIIPKLSDSSYRVILPLFVPKHTTDERPHLFVSLCHIVIVL